MKYTFILLLIFSVGFLNAQEKSRNRLEMGYYFGGADESPALITGLKLSYAYDLGLGIFIKPSYRQFQGGDDGSNFKLEEFEGNQIRSYQSKSIGIAIQKAINSSKYGSFNLSLGGIISRDHTQTIERKTGLDKTIYKIPEFKSETQIGAELELGYYHIFRDKWGMLFTVNLTTTVVIVYGVGIFFEF